MNSTGQRREEGEEEEKKKGREIAFFPSSPVHTRGYLFVKRDKTAVCSNRSTSDGGEESIPYVRTLDGSVGSTRVDRNG